MDEATYCIEWDGGKRKDKCRWTQEKQDRKNRGEEGIGVEIQTLIKNTECARLCDCLTNYMI